MCKRSSTEQEAPVTAAAAGAAAVNMEAVAQSSALDDVLEHSLGAGASADVACRSYVVLAFFFYALSNASVLMSAYSEQQWS